MGPAEARREEKKRKSVGFSTPTKDDMISPRKESSVATEDDDTILLLNLSSDSETGEFIDLQKKTDKNNDNKTKGRPDCMAEGSRNPQASEAPVVGTLPVLGPKPGKPALADKPGKLPKPALAGIEPMGAGPNDEPMVYTPRPGNCHGFNRRLPYSSPPRKSKRKPMHPKKK